MSPTDTHEDVQYDQYTEPAVEYDKTQGSMRLLKKIVRGSSKTALVFSGLVGVFHIQNPEVIPAIEAWKTYEAPAPGDIIPERVGCDIEESERLQEAASSVEAPVHVRYDAAQDAEFQEVNNNISAAGSFLGTSTEGFVASERLFWPSDNYFNAGVHQYESSIGIDMTFFMNEGDAEFRIDDQAVEQMIHDILYRTDLYDNPEVRDIVECKRGQVIGERILDGNTADVNIIADGDKSFEGNNVVTRTIDKNDAHSSGLGISDIGLRLMLPGSLGGTLFAAGGMTSHRLTPDHLMLVAGGNHSLEVSQRVLNRRFLHELAHILLFHDLSDTISERDEQERLVKYVERKLMNYYYANDNLPLAVVVR